MKVGSEMDLSADIIITWSLTGLSILGAILNIKKKRSGFAVYTIANAGWIAVDVYHGIYAQAALFIVFTGLSIWGWIEWGKRGWDKVGLDGL